MRPTPASLLFAVFGLANLGVTAAELPPIPEIKRIVPPAGTGPKLQVRLNL